MIKPEKMDQNAENVTYKLDYHYENSNRYMKAKYPARRLSNYQLLHVVHGILTGGSVSKTYPKTYRIVFSTYRIFHFIFFAGGAILYSLKFYKDVKKVLYGMFALLCIFFEICIPMTYYRYFQTPNEVLLQLNRDLKVSRAELRRRSFLLRFCYYITLFNMMFDTCLYVVFCILQITTTCLLNDEEEFSSAESFYYVHILIPYCKDRRTYLITAIFFNINRTIIYPSAGCYACVMLNQNVELYTKCLHITDNLSNYNETSKNAFKKIERDCIPHDAATGAGNIDDEYSKRIEFERENVAVYLQKIIESHHEFQLLLVYLKDYFDADFSFLLVIVGIVPLQVITMIYLVEMSLNEIIILSFMLIVYTSTWLGYAVAGLLYERMMVKFQREVLNVPWYYLDPRRRKTFIIFLQLLKRSTKIYGLKVYILQMSVFLSALKLYYSYGSFLAATA